MGGGNFKSGFVGQLLKFPFPKPDPPAIAAAEVRFEVEAFCCGITPFSEPLPPAADALNGKSGGIAINANIHPILVGGDEGGRRAAVMYTLIETAKLNGVDPKGAKASPYEAFAPAEARRLAELRLALYAQAWQLAQPWRSPSWASGVAIPGIPDEQALIREVAAWQDRRNQHQTKADWRFTTANSSH